MQKKVCMVGGFAVGKTSLVARFVKSIFSEKYLTTVGVKIDKKVVRVNDKEITLILWDLAGEDEFLQVRMSYLRGCAGYLLVADGTRLPTLEKAADLRSRIERELGRLPFVLAVNKLDLDKQWEVDDAAIRDFGAATWVKTSAKTGEGVEEAFAMLVRQTC